MKKELKITWDVMQVLKESLENNNSELMKSWTCILDTEKDKNFIMDLKLIYLYSKKHNNTLEINDLDTNDYIEIFTKLLNCVNEYKKAIENKKILACIFVNISKEAISEIQKIIEILK